MPKIIKIDDLVVVTFDSGNIFQRSGVTDGEFEKIVSTTVEEDLIPLVCPEIHHVVKVRAELVELEDRVRRSNILTWKNNCIYFPLVSNLTVPQELAVSILDAEDDGDNVKLETYKNFWTLLSLNPNEECRSNLWWFLNQFNFTIAKCGFFVAYRNVDKTSTEGVYTDHYTHKFRIRIGDMVTMKREECDCDPNQECSRGLHLASPNWLNINYFGSVGLVCLCNPADVVSVPKRSDYGKLRTCAYLPIDKLEYNTEGRVIPYPKETGFECDLVPKVIYEGIIGTETQETYRLEIPDIPELNKNIITDNLLEIAKTCIIDRNILYDSQQKD